jgi:hypothetical protein
MKPELVAFSHLDSDQDNQISNQFVYRNEDKISPFMASPSSGLLEPNAVTMVNFVFAPENSGHFCSIYRLNLVGVPNLDSEDSTSNIVSAEFELNGECLPIVGTGRYVFSIVASKLRNASYYYLI